MNSTFVPQLLGLSGEQKLKLGIVAMAGSGYPDLSMIDVVKKLLRTPEVNLTALLGLAYRAAGLDKTVDVRTALTAVDAYLDTMPHDSTSTLFRTVEIVFTIIMSVLLMLRFVGRRSLTGRIRVDDWVMLVAWMSTVTLTIGILMGTVKSYGYHHIWDFTYNKWKKNLQITWINQIIFSICKPAIKLSWLLFYWSLTPMPWFRKAVLVVGLVTIVTSVCAFTTILFQCRPISFWNDPMHAKCINVQANLLILGTVSIVQDVVILLLPIPVVIYTLKLATREKVIVMAMFACGTFACYAGILRVLYSKEFTSPDMTYKKSYTAFWALVELDLAIAISSVPAIRGLSNRYFPLPSRANSLSIPKPTVAMEENIRLRVPAPASGIVRDTGQSFIETAQTLTNVSEPAVSMAPRALSIASAAVVEMATTVSVTNVHIDSIALVHSNSRSANNSRRASDWDRDLENSSAPLFS